MKDSMRYKKTTQKRFGNLITISKKELEDFMKLKKPIVKKGFDLELNKNDLVDLIKFKQPIQKKGYNVLLENVCVNCGGVITEDLRKWFKQKWVNIGKKVGGKHPKCGTSGDKQGYAKCVPASKAASMSKKDKKSATRRKRTAQNKANRGGKASSGQGKKPIMVKTEARGTCWVGFKQVGMKDKGGRKVPNCVKETTEIFYEENGQSHGYTLEYLRLPEDINEAEYQGRKVKLGKPMQGDTKKFKVYVKNPKGNVVKVNFGQGGGAKGGTMRIRKSNPKARKSFRARHNCDSPGPRHKARYWSCRKW